MTHPLFAETSLSFPNTSFSKVRVVSSSILPLLQFDTYFGLLYKHTLPYKHPTPPLSLSLYIYISYMHQQHKLSYTNPSSMEKAPQSTFYHSLSLTDPIVFLFYNTVFLWVTILSKFSARFLSLLLLLPRPHEEELRACAMSRSHHAEENPPSNRGDDLELLGEDVEVVLVKMGIRYDLNGERFEEKLHFDELSTMFEEKEPSLEEVKQAFAVFDENSDGFIDAVELMRVLSELGFKDGVKLDECERMIASYDENKDGRIDFNEFLKFMESSVC